MSKYTYKIDFENRQNEINAMQNNSFDISDLYSNELLKFAIESGKLDANALEFQMRMKKVDKIIKEKELHIWKAADGYYNCWVKDLSNKRHKLRRKTEEELREAIYKYFHIKRANPTMREVFYLSMEEVKDSLSFNTYDRYMTTFRCTMEKYPIVNKKMKDITMQDYMNFEHEYNGYKVKTIRQWKKVLINLNYIIRYAHRNGYSDITVNDFATDIKPRSNKFIESPGKDEVFKDEEIEVLANYCFENPGEIKNLVILLEIVTGMRVGEISALKKEDFDRENSRIHIQRSEVKVGEYKKDIKRKIDVVPYIKTGDDRYIYVPEVAFEIYERACELSPKSDYLFCNPDNTRVSCKQLIEYLPKLCGRLGIGEVVIKNGRKRSKYKSFHKIRKWYISTLTDGGTIGIAQHQAGHSSSSTTMKYYYKNTKEKEVTIETVNRLFGNIKNDGSKKEGENE